MSFQCTQVSQEELEAAREVYANMSQDDKNHFKAIGERNGKGAVMTIALTAQNMNAMRVCHQSEYPNLTWDEFSLLFWNEVTEALNGTEH